MACIKQMADADTEDQPEYETVYETVYEEEPQPSVGEQVADTLTSIATFGISDLVKADWSSKEAVAKNLASVFTFGLSDLFFSIGSRKPKYSPEELRRMSEENKRRRAEQKRVAEEREAKYFREAKQRQVEGIQRSAAEQRRVIGQKVSNFDREMLKQKAQMLNTQRIQKQQQLQQQQQQQMQTNALKTQAFARDVQQQKQNLIAQANAIRDSQTIREVLNKPFAVPKAVGTQSLIKRGRGKEDSIESILMKYYGFSKKDATKMAADLMYA